MRARHVVPLLVAAGAAYGYLRWYRPWQLTWGATPDEVTRALPGDDLVPRPVFDATRAITIEAPPHEVWPWLVQAGVGRAGWYSYDLLDNLGRPSASEINPQWQQLAVGDLVPMSPDGTQGIEVLALDAPTSMVWGSPGTSWVWQLDPVGSEATRLVTRIRSRPTGAPSSLAFGVLLELADVWMLRKMLRTVQLRAQRLG
ncbi:hypothetical protein [Cellulomonas citrea]|uniref:hypothetical protein n=1 Tax=Cellulomonas citrea TaxID=1909423 RepID=UPI00135BFEBB|nr:hypothetical protein [Cellulomonas citrea]